MPDEIDLLLEEILVDAYGEYEQLGSFEVAFEESARYPFPARIVGTSVEVIKVEFQGDERRGLTAVCRRDGGTHRVALADLTPGPITIDTFRLIAAYRRWSGLPPLQPEQGAPPGEPWRYQRVATGGATVDESLAPLDLKPEGSWDPADQYWGEADAPLDPIIEQVIAAGPRAQFEMEQIIPGVAADDWDIDPVADAAEMHRQGYDRESTRVLKDLIAQDGRCIDAWVHLGNIAFDARGPKAALELYNTAVTIGERSLPDGFDGVLPRGLIDNRPFLRALYGFGLCAWRQRRWDAADVVFTNLVWIDGGSTWDSISSLNQVRSRCRWTHY